MMTPGDVTSSAREKRVENVKLQIDPHKRTPILLSQNRGDTYILVLSVTSWCPEVNREVRRVFPESHTNIRLLEIIVHDIVAVSF